MISYNLNDEPAAGKCEGMQLCRSFCEAIFCEAVYDVVCCKASAKQLAVCCEASSPRSIILSPLAMF